MHYIGGGGGVSGSAKIQITQVFVKQKVKTTSNSLPICMTERIATALASLRGVKLGFVRFCVAIHGHVCMSLDCIMASRCCILLMLLGTFRCDSVALLS